MEGVRNSMENWRCLENGERYGRGHCSSLFGSGMHPFR